jgi:L-alanine-DL-glutamate epimerase-like enolase superfamily enzyme
VTGRSQTDPEFDTEQDLEGDIVSRVVRYETWICRRDIVPGTGASPDDRRIRRATHGSEYVVIRLTDEEGRSGIATSISYRTEIARSYLDEIIGPLVVGRRVEDREAIWQDLYTLNRRIVFFPHFLPGPVDVALWDLAAKEVGLPLFEFLGAYRTSLPAYASSQFMATIDEYLTEARRYQQLGVNAYKAHPGGDWRHHIEIAEALRAEFPDMTLMLDPAGVDYSLTEAVKVGRALERLDYYWLEEPFYDQYVGKYAELCRTLDISIATTEASYGGPAGVAEFIRAGAADIVRADVAWKWGVTGTKKILSMAEAFGLNCELHTAMSAMDVANLHVACSAKNSEYFELYAPHELWHFPVQQPLQLDDHGRVHVPADPGLGVTIDWDLVDDETLVKHEIAS